MFEIRYNFNMGGEIVPALCCCFAYEVASVLRNMAHLAINRGFKISNVSIKKL